jgi:hypothetical protein
MKLLLIFSLMSFLTFSQSNIEEDNLFWNDTIKVKWTDFKGGVPFGDLGIKKAAIATEVVAECIGYIDNCVPVFVVKTFCDRNSSWVVEKNDNLLRHEQGHFDIAEIYARKIRKIFFSYNEEKDCEMENYSETFAKLMEELVLTHKMYDDEVYFSEVHTLEWYKKIEHELNELEDYKFAE